MKKEVKKSVLKTIAKAGLKSAVLGANSAAVLDVIDYTKSKRIFSDEKQRILVFERYAFMDCLELRQHHIFKIVDEPQRWAFVSDVFKTIVESKGFTGFIFRLVWDSEISALPL